MGLPRGHSGHRGRAGGAPPALLRVDEELHAHEPAAVGPIPSGVGSSLRAVEGENLRRAVGEFVGGLALIFVGAGSVMTGGGGLFGVAIAHGLSLAIMVTALGHISG